ncbi:MAG: 16S rRNA (cytidine(1402)-2'-O)-methyltransferase [Verrucomicrobia bacterium]|nr:16S rRNA (cytidine(1402)-2'-O)-methyltransferase [Verrucomicrobiota bacterium]
MLYLVATPIGNLSDLSFRAVETLKACDYILCEDTRHSSYLLNHYQINKPLKSYHRFNESKELEAIVEDLRNGRSIALISDAGTPILCDPGHLLIKKCREENIEVTAIGGPCAALLALTLSGFDPLPFQFVGFLPKKQSELTQLLSQILLYEGTSIAYETPHRIVETLEIANSLAPDRNLCVMRELTKMHEEFLKGTASVLISHFKEHPPRGELVFLIERSYQEEDWSHLSLKDHVAAVQKQWDLSLNDAIKTVAQIRKLPKRAVYQEIHKN